MTDRTHAQPAQPSPTGSREHTEGSTIRRESNRTKEGSTHRDRFISHHSQTGFLERQRAYVKKFMQIFRGGDKAKKECQSEFEPKILDLSAGGQLKVRMGKRELSMNRSYGTGTIMNPGDREMIRASLRVRDYANIPRAEIEEAFKIPEGLK